MPSSRFVMYITPCLTRGPASLQRGTGKPGDADSVMNFNSLTPEPHDPRRTAA